MQIASRYAQESRRTGRSRQTSNGGIRPHHLSISAHAPSPISNPWTCACELPQFDPDTYVGWRGLDELSEVSGA